MLIPGPTAGLRIMPCTDWLKPKCWNQSLVRGLESLWLAWVENRVSFLRSLGNMEEEDLCKYYPGSVWKKGNCGIDAKQERSPWIGWCGEEILDSVPFSISGKAVFSWWWRLAYVVIAVTLTLKALHSGVDPTILLPYVWLCQINSTRWG